MKRIFLDTNILIDYIDNRAGADNAEQIFACGFSDEALLYASSLSFANMAYIIKSRTQEEKYNALRQMASVVEILPPGKQEVISSYFSHSNQREGRFENQVIYSNDHDINF